MDIIFSNVLLGATPPAHSSSSIRYVVTYWQDAAEEIKQDVVDKRTRNKTTDTRKHIQVFHDLTYVVVMLRDDDVDTNTDEGRYCRRKEEAFLITMAEAQGDDDDEIFVYMGGDQQVPALVRRARIHKSVKIVLRRAFKNRYQLISVEFHDDIDIVETEAFRGCKSLRGVKLLGVKIIQNWAFQLCGLTDVEFGNKLEAIGWGAFYHCYSLKNIRMPTLTTIGSDAFAFCRELTEVEFDKDLRTLQGCAFRNCSELKRVALPLKDDMIDVGVFDNCPKLETVDLVGGVHETVASLHMESWRSEITGEINRINHTLPTITAEKTEEIQQWMRSVIRHLNHFKTEHKALLKEATTLLELALWKANLDNEGRQVDQEGVSTTRESRKRARREICVTSGASIVIKNVLPYLQLSE